MSIWDSVKPKKQAVVASAIVISKDQREVALAWTDGSKSVVAARRLRQYCPCAGCVEEWSGKRTFEVETIPVETKILEAQPVGNYALSFTFSDLHRTGIYQWEYLRDLSNVS
jgi:DUF971 family protein